jgi:hypothetical protein
MFRYIIVVIAFAIVSVLIFVDPFNFPKEIKDALTPWATLALALVAILTILHSDLREERRNRLHRLNQVMDWATDVISITQVVETPEIPLLRRDSSFERYRQIEKLNDFKRVNIEGEHVKIISLRVDKELCSTVTAVTQAIDELLKENWHSLDVPTMSEWLAEHEKRIYDLVRILINETTKRLDKC